MLQKLEQIKSALETAKLNPQSKAEIEKFISIAKNEASANKAAQEKKENAEKQAKKSAKRWFVFDLLALGAMLFFPLIEIAGTPCNFFGLIEAICNGFAVGLCILLIIYIICILCIISELKDPPEAYPVIFTFVLAVGAVCLFGGSNYNTFIWLYIFLIPFVSFFMKK